MHIQIGPWDIALIAAVSVMSTALAYVHSPRWKVFVLNVPIPFTLATLALGKPIGATNVLGGLTLLWYAHGVRMLYYRAKVPIVLAIALGDLGYCVLGWATVAVLPDTEVAFWVCAAVTLAIAFGFWLALPHRQEPGHRTPLPVHIKLPIIACLITVLVLIKNTLKGFFTIFPMVSTVAAYEARKSLWAMSRQMPILLLTMVPMMIVSHVSFPMILPRASSARTALLLSLAIGWAVFWAILVPLTRFTWSRDGAQVERSDNSEAKQEP